MSWQPIESAPRDARLLLGWEGNAHKSPCFGNWNTDAYSKNPRPYWSTDRERVYGTRDAREVPPTHWQPSPDSPEATP